MSSVDYHESSSLPHVLIFSLPPLDHVIPKLHLAELLCLANFKVTFLYTTQNHQYLTQHTDIEARFSHYPGFEFKTVPDGLPDDHPRTGGQNNFSGFVKEMVQGLTSSAKPFLREILFGSSENARITCLIVDGWMDFATDLAKEAEVPVILFRAASASCNWCYYCIPKLIIEAEDIPFKGNEEMDQLVRNAPGMDSFLRYCDLPNFYRGQDISSYRDLQNSFTSEIHRNQLAHSLILNTLEDLESSTLSHIRSKITKVYSIGPIHAHLKYRLNPEETTLSNDFSSSLWKVDQSCISWLDQKPNKSVVYVSFGSLTILTRDQFVEIWVGLVQSKKYFLWEIRPSLITGNEANDPTQDYLLEETKKRGYIVGLVPHEEVLAHRAVGGFLTHCGWSSTLESIIAGVPMLCWPYFADSQVNNRYVSEVWKIGLDMKDTCERTIVEKMINDLMGEKKEELQRSIDKISHLAKKSIAKGGSSYSNLNLLIEDIKSMCKEGKH